MSPAPEARWRHAPPPPLRNPEVGVRRGAAGAVGRSGLKSGGRAGGRVAGDPARDRRRVAAEAQLQDVRPKPGRHAEARRPAG